MAPYSKYPTSAFTVNTGQNAKQPAKPSYATQPYRPPPAGGPIGGFANQGYKPPTSSLPGIAPHALSAATASTDAAASTPTATTTASPTSVPSTGQFAYPDIMAKGWAGLSADQLGTAQHAAASNEDIAAALQAYNYASQHGGVSGWSREKAMALLSHEASPLSNAQYESVMGALPAEAAYAGRNSSLQAPVNPSGLPSTLGDQYSVPNGSTIGAVTGYTGAQIGSGLYNGAAGEPGTAGYTGIGAVPQGYMQTGAQLPPAWLQGAQALQGGVQVQPSNQPPSIIALAQALAGGR